MKRVLLLMVTLSYFFSVMAQEEAPYLEIINKKRVSDTTRLNAYIKLYEIVRKSNPDSAYKILLKAEQVAIQANNHIKRAGTQQRLIQQLATIYFLQAKYQESKGNYGLAINLFEKAASWFRSAGDSASVASVDEQIAKVYITLGDYAKAIEYYRKGLEYLEQDTLNYGRTLSELAGLYDKTGDWEMAKKYYAKSLKILSPAGSRQAADVMQRLADIYKNRGDTAYALTLLHKSLKINSRLNDKNRVFDLLLSIGQIYYKQHQPDSAMKYFLMAYNVANSLTPAYQAKAQYHIAQLYLSKDLKRAEQIAQKSFYFAEYEHDTLMMIKAADLLKEINLAQGNCPQAFKYLNIKSKLEQELTMRENAKKLRQVELVAKAREQLSVDSLRRALYAEQISHRNDQDKFKQTLSMGMMFIAFLLIFIILLSLKHKRNIESMEQQIEDNPHVRELLDKLNMHQLQIQEHQRQIDTLLNQFEKDFNNARYLIQAVLPDDSILSKAVKEFFRVFIPKKQISGDFYWWALKDETLFVAVGDTTGSAISGALISILGIHLLNEAVNTQNLADPSQILSWVRNGVIKHLHQHNQGHHSEHIKLSLVRLHLNKLSLAFAGARQSIFIVPGRELDISGEKGKKFHAHKRDGVLLYELKPDLMTLGLLGKMHEFETLTLELPESTLIYLFSDGFYNQFGGEFDEKFGRKKFRSLIMEIADKPLQEQKKILEQTFKDWKGEHDQTDDVTIIGFKTK